MPASLAWLQMTALVTPSPFAYVPEVEQPRSFGHFVGDILTQRIALDQGGSRFQPASLPTPDRVGLWFQRLPPRLETDAAGRRWLVIDYQVINSPLLPISVALPALTVATGASAPIEVDGWPIQISPLAAKPAYANTEPLALRPDRLPAPLPTRPLERQLAGWSACLALVLCAWLVWVLWADRDARRLPFARALRQLRGHAWAGDDARAWICVHRALDETAGRVIQECSLDHLFSAAPQLLPLRPELQDFFRRSSVRFFAAAPTNAPFPLLEICQKLRRIEKRMARGRAVRS